MAGMKPGAWCHIEVPAASLESAKRFYGGVFGWTFTDVPEMKYTLYSAGEGEIGGGLFNPPPNFPRQITNYVNVADLDASAAKVQELGGRVLGDRTEVPGHGWFRMITDPEGNVLALWQGLHQAPAPAPAKKKAPARRKPAGRAKKRR